MKTLLKIVTVICLIGLASCSTEVENNDAELKNVNQKSSIQNKYLDSDLYNVYHASVSVVCKGNCDEESNSSDSIQTGSESCGTRLDLRTSIKSCTCEGCKMEVKFENSIYGKSADISSLYQLKVFEQIGEYLVDSYGIDDVVIMKSFKAYATPEAYISQMLFYDSNGLVQSVMHSISRVSGDTYIIDCKGPCDSEEERCTEEYDLKNGKASCSCEGGCKMTVTKVDTIEP